MRISFLQGYREFSVEFVLVFTALTRAERKSKAEKAKKKRPTPYIRTAAKATSSSGNNASEKSKVRPGVCYNYFKPGHWQFECPEKNKGNNKITELRTILQRESL
jgi:hypothetical protein